MCTGEIKNGQTTKQKSNLFDLHKTRVVLQFCVKKQQNKALFGE